MYTTEALNELLMNLMFAYDASSAMPMNTEKAVCAAVSMRNTITNAFDALKTTRPNKYSNMTILEAMDSEGL